MSRRPCEQRLDDPIVMWTEDGPFKNRVKEWMAVDGFIVLANGCFDLLHAGHLRLLRWAKTRSWLDAERMMFVVAINSDKSVERQGKGKDRPIVPFADRASAVLQVKGVDWVVGFEEDTPLELIRKIHPHLLVKGEEYYGQEVVGADIVRKNGGSVLFCPHLEGVSTTSIVKKIKS